MGETVGSLEARTHLTALLERVARGETITITEHGKPVAQLVPMRPEQDPTSQTTTAPQYQHLEPRPGSNYRQWFLKGRRIRAAIVYEVVHGPDPYTPEEFAREYQVPLEAVHEALDYVARNLPLIQQEREREAADIRARGLDRPQRPDGGASSRP